LIEALDHSNFLVHQVLESRWHSQSKEEDEVKGPEKAKNGPTKEKAIQQEAALEEKVEEEEDDDFVSDAKIRILWTIESSMALVPGRT